MAYVRCPLSTLCKRLLRLLSPAIEGLDIWLNYMDLKSFCPLKIKGFRWQCPLSTLCKWLLWLLSPAIEGLDIWLNYLDLKSFCPLKRFSLFLTISIFIFGRASKLLSITLLFKQKVVWKYFVASLARFAANNLCKSQNVLR